MGPRLWTATSRFIFLTLIQGKDIFFSSFPFAQDTREMS